MDDSFGDGDRVRTAEVISALSLATDLAMGVRLEYGLRSTLVAMRLCDRLGVDRETASQTYYLCLLFYVGCTAPAVRRKDIVATGIERVPRTKGVRGGVPLLEDGRVLPVSNVIWCTGFTPGFRWIDLPLPTDNGIPIHNRGIVESCPGLYFIGLLFLYSVSSPLVGGVGRDAKHIVDHLVSNRSARQGEVLGQPATK